jgi:hypothetical protein
MRPRTRLNEQHAATPLPTAAAADGRRILRSHRKMQGNRSIDSNASNNVAAAAIPAKAASLTQSANVDRIIPNSAAEPAADIAPLFRAHAERTLEQIRGVVESRKGAMEGKVEDLRRQLHGQLLFAKRSLPDSVRNMKVKDYDARYDCDLLEMLKARALGIFLGLEEDEDDGMDASCPATIQREAGCGTGRRPLPSSSSAAAAAASAVVAAPAGYATPAVARAKPSNAAFWSTTAKKYVGRRQPNVAIRTSNNLTMFHFIIRLLLYRNKTAAKSKADDSPDEKILTVSKKKGAILESCGMDLLTLAHDPDMAGALDVASLENIQKLHQLSAMILQHQEKYRQKGIGMLGAVAEEEE